MAVKKITIFWRDIRSQILIQKGRKRDKMMLEHRFQEAIDRAAMRAGKGSSDAYMADWRRDIKNIEANDPQSIVDHEIEILETMFSDDLLEKTVKSKGIKER